MAYHYFIPYSTKEIMVKFKCENCGEDIEETILVPYPDMDGDDIDVGDAIDNDGIQCSNCEKEYGYSIASFGDLELDDLDDDQVDFFDMFYGEQTEEISVLQKWNNRLLLKELSKKFIELVLEKDPSKDGKTIRREWFNEKLLLKDSFFREDPSKNTVYQVQAFGGRELLTYYVKDSDINEFENDMKSVWEFLEDCYDKDWWIQKYGDFSPGHPVNNLNLIKNKVIIGAHWRK